MRLNELQPQPGSRKKEKRIGRGIGSGHGKTSTKGHKGGLARSGGGGKGPGFEGGQMPLIRRIPKRGFTPLFREPAAVVNLENLNRFDGKSAVTPEQLKNAGLVRRSAAAVKILGQGELSKPLTIQAHQFSRSAIEKIRKAGGKADVIRTAAGKKDAAAQAE
ncbi:MAG: 50S ribosomal protein L15 [Nitrospirae bacterium]|nr:50S ribosomal protein L15 [Nitrospirota bacterium]